MAAGRPCVAGAKRKGAGWRGPRPARLARQRRDLPGGSSVLAVSDLTAGSPIPGRCGDGHAPRRRHEQRLLPRASGREPRPRIRHQRLEPCRHGRDRRRRTCALARRLARRGGTSRHPRPRTLGRGHHPATLPAPGGRHESRTQRQHPTARVGRRKARWGHRRPPSSRSVRVPTSSHI